MSDFRQDFVLKAPADLKIQQKIAMDKKTMLVKLFDKYGNVLFEDKIDLVEQTIFGNLPPKKEEQTFPEKEEEVEVDVEPKDESELEKPKNDGSMDSQDYDESDDESDDPVAQEQVTEEKVETETTS